MANRGATYLAVKRYDEALADLNRAIELDPRNATSIANRGATYLDLKRYDEALADFNRAIELDPGDVFAILRRGQTYRAMKRYGKALADFHRAAKLDPEKARAIAASKLKAGPSFAFGGASGSRMDRAAQERPLSVPG